MIGIRSVTYQLPKQYSKDHITQIAKLSRIWDSSYSSIRTQRVCLCPLTKKTELSNYKIFSNLCDMSSIRWFNVSIDPYHSSDIFEIFDFAHTILYEYGRSFVNILGVVDNELRFDIFKHSAELMRKVSTININGRDNFRLGMSINIKPDGPFFPFTYSSGIYGFSIALELTQDINIICNSMQNSNLNELRLSIIECLVPQIEKINATAQKIAHEERLEFKGFDFSIAPIIGENGSVMTILNSLGIYDFGKTGTLFATGYITNILKHLAYRFKSVGFSGVMYSLLEDFDMCSINNERGISLDQLISLSTMCGCGADMIPVYGGIQNEELMSIYLDVAGISCRLNKPLGVRILPIPKCGRGKSQFTNFHDDADFIANTKVVSPEMNLLTEFGDKLIYLNINNDI